MPKTKRKEKAGSPDLDDFISRSFTDADVDKILEKGGGLSYSNFKRISKDNIASDGYHQSLFSKQNKERLGKQVYSQFFENQNVRLNTSKRIVARKGKKFFFNNRTYKGGMFVPKSYLTQR